MKLALWMTVGSVLAAAAMTLGARLAGIGAAREIWLGMAGPLAAAVLFWLALVRRARREPQGLTKLVIAAFVAKFVFFAAYVAVLLKSGQVQAKAFIVCFVVFYIALHVVETGGLRNRQAAGK